MNAAVRLSTICTNSKEFSPFRLDTVNECLWRHRDTGPDERILLPPKPFAVLRYLVEHPGRLVTQDELLEALWPDTFVQPEVLKSQVRDIRMVLADVQGRHESGYLATGEKTITFPAKQLMVRSNNDGCCWVSFEYPRHRCAIASRSRVPPLGFMWGPWGVCENRWTTLRKQDRDGLIVRLLPERPSPPYYPPYYKDAGIDFSDPAPAGNQFSTITTLEEHDCFRAIAYSTDGFGSLLARHGTVLITNP
jgi:Transcriptional regulatory protein, C terminal